MGVDDAGRDMDEPGIFVEGVDALGHGCYGNERGDVKGRELEVRALATTDLQEGREENLVKIFPVTVCRPNDRNLHCVKWDSLPSSLATHDPHDRWAEEGSSKDDTSRRQHHCHRRGEEKRPVALHSVGEV